MLRPNRAAAAYHPGCFHQPRSLSVIDHLSLGSTRFPAAVAFYRAVLAPLGLALVRESPQEAAFGRGDDWCFFLYPAEGAPPVTGQRMHVAFRAPSRAAVAAAHRAALDAQGHDLFTPRPRPDISDSYFGAMFADLDGHRVEVLTHAA